MSAFLIAQHDVGDPAAFQEWRAKVIPIIERRGGRFVVRSNQVQVLEGDLRASDVVIIEFPDMATLNATRAELREHSDLRRRAARSVLLVYQI